MSKTTLYLGIACAVLLLIILAMMWMGHAANIPAIATAAAVATATIAESKRMRECVRKDIGETLADTPKSQEALGETNKRAEQVAVDVSHLDADHLKEEGNHLFGGLTPDQDITDPGEKA